MQSLQSGTVSNEANSPPQPEPSEVDDPSLVAARLGVGRYERHVFLCAGPNCCNQPEGLAAWTHLKTRLRTLERQGQLPPGAIFTTLVGCFGICHGGPILLIYPEGVWYGGVTAEVCERIIDEHIGRGRVLEEHAFGFNQLPAAPDGE